MDIPPECEVSVPRIASRGKAYVYVLPRDGEDLIKLGFSRDPFERFRTLHPRFYALFDLRQGLLIELDTIKDARRIERLLIERWPEHRASAPYDVSAHAGGHTEWFRGIGDHVEAFARRVAVRYGFTVHAPLRAWLRERMLDDAENLYDWARGMFEVIEWQGNNLSDHSRDPRFAAALRETLDAFVAMDVEIEERLPSAVLRWYTSA